MLPEGAREAAAEADVWRALASPWRRRLLDQLRTGPATTGELAAELPELSRFAVMQHLAVLTDAGLVLPERRGRDRVNYPAPVGTRNARVYPPRADTGPPNLLALRGAAEKGPSAMSYAIEPIRTVRL